MAAIFRETEKILQEGNPDAIVNTLGFIKDATLYEHADRASFRQRLASAPIWELFQKLLLAPHCHLRGQVIITIGKLGFKEHAHLLLDAFPFYFENDPINLESIFWEHRWLTGSLQWRRMRLVAASDHYLKRWSLCAFLDDGLCLKQTKSCMSVLSRLKNDPHPLVAAEANWILKRSALETEKGLPEAKRRRELERIFGHRPSVTFDDASMRFMNSWANKGKTDYTLEEFDRFATDLGAI
jgi:hypothetical protein